MRPIRVWFLEHSADDPPEALGTTFPASPMFPRRRSFQKIRRTHPIEPPKIHSISNEKALFYFPDFLLF